jgi:hypothetical protein
VFSGVALLDSPLRARLLPATLEQLAVLQRYSRMYGHDKLAEFAETRVDPAD